jgi:hypothetical protein
MPSSYNKPKLEKKRKKQIKTMLKETRKVR